MTKIEKQIQLKKNMQVLLLLKFILLINIMFFQGNTIFGQNWGRVDVRTLLILHPKMATFDYSIGRFYRDSALILNQDKVREQLNISWEKAQPMLRSLQTKQSAIIKKRNDVLQRWAETLNSLAERAVATEARNIDYKKLGEEYETRYKSQLAALDNELEVLEKEMQQAIEQAYSPIYLTTQETIAKINEIKNEIMQILNILAKQYNLVAVIDTSYGEEEIKLIKSLASIPTQQDHYDILAANLFHRITNFDEASLPTGQIPEGNKMVDIRQHIMPMLKSNQLSTLRQYLEYRPYLAKQLAKLPSLGGIIVYGGIDITPHAARMLFEKYNIPVDLKNTYMQLIADYQNFLVSKQFELERILPTGLVNQPAQQFAPVVNEEKKKMQK